MRTSFSFLFLLNVTVRSESASDRKTHQFNLTKLFSKLGEKNYHYDEFNEKQGRRYLAVPMSRAVGQGLMRLVKYFGRSSVMSDKTIVN